MAGATIAGPDPRESPRPLAALVPSAALVTSCPPCRSRPTPALGGGRPQGSGASRILVWTWDSSRTNRTQEYLGVGDAVCLRSGSPTSAWGESRLHSVCLVAETALPRLGLLAATLAVTRPARGHTRSRLCTPRDPHVADAPCPQNPVPGAAPRVRTRPTEISLPSVNCLESSI